MSGTNLIINPWKLAFFLIFVANIIFHSSSSFLLLFILFCIFSYVYFFLFFLFNNFADASIKELGGAKTFTLENTSKFLDKFAVLFEYLKILSRTYFTLVLFWATYLLKLVCVEYTNDKNYSLLLLDSYYNSYVKVFLKRQETIDG
jgi:hypothetical protein